MQALKVILTVLVVTVTSLAATSPAQSYSAATPAPEVHPLVVEELDRRLTNQRARIPFLYLASQRSRHGGGSPEAHPEGRQELGVVPHPRLA